MGIASHDLTGDGYPEFYLTSQAANRLQTLADGPAQPTYRDIGHQRGITARARTRATSAAVHRLARPVRGRQQRRLRGPLRRQGQRGRRPDFAIRDPSNLLLGQPDGTFVEAADRPGILNFDAGAARHWPT